MFIYDSNLVLTSTLRHVFELQQNIIMTLSNLYITVASGARITTYDFATLQLLWDIILEAEVVSVKIQQKWVIATTAGKIWQIGPEGLLMSYATTQNDLSKAGAITTQDGYEAVAWSEGGNLLQRWVLDDTYDCDGSLGCQCIPDYCFNDASMLVCSFTGMSCVDYANNSSLNATNATSSNDTTNNTSLNTTTNNTSLNTTTNNTSLNNTTNSSISLNTTNSSSLNTTTNNNTTNATSLNTTTNSTSLNSTNNNTNSSTINATANSTTNSTTNSTVNNTNIVIINYTQTNTSNGSNTAVNWTTQIPVSLDPCLFRN
jgi:hypothetical protein